MKKDKKKIKKPAGKKMMSAKKIQKRKVTRKKKPAKIEGLFGAKVPETAADKGVKILVREEVGEEMNQPITESVEEITAVEVSPLVEIPSAVLAEEIDQESISDGIENEELPLEVEPEISSDYMIEEIQEVDNSSYLSDRGKSIIMYVAITCIMIIIVIFWGLSIKYSLSQNLQDASLNEQEESADVKQIKESLNNIKDDFATMSNLAKEQLDQALNFSDQTKEQVIENQIKDEVAEVLEQKLNNLNNSVSNGNTSN